MYLHCAAIYQDVVQEDKNEVIKVIGEDIIHHIHEMQRDRSNTKRRYQELI